MRMTVDEHRLVAPIFTEGCRTQLPDNMHISLDIMRRDLGIAPSAIVERMRAMASIGFEEEIRSDEDTEMTCSWCDGATEVAVRMLDVGIGDDGCRQCAEQCIESLDFSLLASSTTGPR